MSVEILLAVAGWLQIAHLPALFAAGRAVPSSADRTRGELAFVVGLGMVVASTPGELAGGGRLGLALTLLLAVIWTGKSWIHFVRLGPAWSGASPLVRWTYRGVGSVFIFLALSYGLGAGIALKRRDDQSRPLARSESPPRASGPICDCFPSAREGERSDGLARWAPPRPTPLRLPQRLPPSPPPEPPERPSSCCLTTSTAGIARMFERPRAWSGVAASPSRTWRTSCRISG